jgi:two-component sensor histidine kinase
MADEDAASHILYIDDDAGLRRLVARALERRGFRVDCATGGLEGAEMAAERRYDLIAVDHYMPGQDGLATLDQIRRLPDPPPVIYVTGSEESRVAVAALKAGAIDYIVKTVGEEFFDLLARSIEQGMARVRTLAEKEQAEARLRESNERLEAMLYEVNHRVANSLQLVSSFVYLQARSVEGADAKAALEDTQRRIAAIAQVHRRLYSGDRVDRVDMAGYLASLLKDLEETWSTPEAPRSITLSAEPVTLDTDQTVAVGVIVNELVSNACKYAYPPDQAGEVRVALLNQGDSFLLRVEDDGFGMPSDGSIKGTGIGSKLVNAMVANLKARLDHDPAHKGVRVTISAPI